MSLIENADLERRCRDLVDAIHIPHPFSIEALFDVVGNRCGGFIMTQPLNEFIPPHLSAMVAANDAVNPGWIMTHPEGDDIWSLLVTSHELGHIMAGHVPCGDRLVAEKAEPSADLVRKVLDDVAAGEVGTGSLDSQGRPILFRCSMAMDLEREAELIGTLLVQRILSAVEGKTGVRDFLVPNADRNLFAERSTQESPAGDVLSRYDQIISGKARRPRKRR